MTKLTPRQKEENAAYDLGWTHSQRMMFGQFRKVLLAMENTIDTDPYNSQMYAPPHKEKE